jgi:hypothetical protein
VVLPHCSCLQPNFFNGTNLGALYNKQVQLQGPNVTYTVQQGDTLQVRRCNAVLLACCPWGAARVHQPLRMDHIASAAPIAFAAALHQDPGGINCPASAWHLPQSVAASLDVYPVCLLYNNPSLQQPSDLQPGVRSNSCWQMQPRSTRGGPTRLLLVCTILLMCHDGVSLPALVPPEAWTATPDLKRSVRASMPALPRLLRLLCMPLPVA